MLVLNRSGGDATLIILEYIFENIPDHHREDLTRCRVLLPRRFLRKPELIRMIYLVKTHPGASDKIPNHAREKYEWNRKKYGNSIELQGNLRWSHNACIKNHWRQKKRSGAVLRKSLIPMFSGPYPDTILERTHEDPAITMLAFLVCPDECLHD